MSVESYGISAAVVADSVSPSYERLITMEIELPRFILSQFNTHRTISRNFQSSRAIPVKRLIEQVKNSPVVPVFWGENQPGMQADWELSSSKKEEAKAMWEEAKEQAVRIAEKLDEVKAHKQIVNRILEPFMWQKGIVTATEKAWRDFISLRLHQDAQPEIQDLAKCIKGAIKGSVPTLLPVGHWHLPYVFSNTVDSVTGKQKFYSGGEEVSLEEAVKISVSCCAQVSYRRLDDSLEKAMDVYDMLNLPSEGVWPNDPPHMSPTEHQALCYDSFYDQGIGREKGSISGNFQTWDFYQLRKMYEKGVEKEFLTQ